MISRVLLVSLIGLTLVGCANNSLSGDVYNASEGKQVRSVEYGTITHVRAVTIQGDKDNNTLGAIGGAVLGGLVGNTIGGGSGRLLAAAGGAVAGGVAGNAVGSALGSSKGVELEIRKDNGQTIMAVQKQDKTIYVVGQRVAISGSGNSITVAPR